MHPETQTQEPLQFPGLFAALDFDPAVYEEEIDDDAIKALTDKNTEVDKLVQSLVETVRNEARNVAFKVNSYYENKMYDGGEDALIDIFGNLDLFVDLKIGDIPSTNENRFKVLCRVAKYLTFLLGELGEDGAKKIIELRDKIHEIAGKQVGLIGVTVLTSQKPEQFALENGMHKDLAVAIRARNAINAGFDAIVCSPQEASMVKYLALKAGNRNIKVITPGIRPKWGAPNTTQSRFATPEDAILAGSDSLVVGSAIVKAEDKAEAITKVEEEMLVGYEAREVLIKEIMEAEKLTYEEAELKYYERLLTAEQRLTAMDIIEALTFKGGVYNPPKSSWKSVPWCKLRSGDFSPQYINLGGEADNSQILLSRIGHDMAELMRKNNIEADMTVGIAMGSVRLSNEVARFANIPYSVYLEKGEDDPDVRGDDLKLEFKKHHVPEGVKKVVLTEDLVTKGTSLKAAKKALEEKGLEVVAVVVVVNRSNMTEVEGVPIYAVEKFDAINISEEEFHRDYPDATIETEPKQHWAELMEAQRNAV